MAPAPCILNVNDDDASRYVVTRTLRTAGLGVHESVNGTDALEAARRGVDLILLDVHLPDLDGFEVCRRLKADPATRQLPVLMLSAKKVGPEHLVQGLEGGADAYLTSPVEPDVLVATVRSFLRLHEALAATDRAARQWEATFDAIRDAVVVFSATGEISRANAAASALLRTPRQLLTGRPILSTLREVLLLDEGLARQITALEQLSRDVQLADRRYLLSLRRVSPLETPEGAVLTLTDLSPVDRLTVAEEARDAAQASEAGLRELYRRLEASEQKLHEQARALERSNADLEQFAYVASHDLQEPLRMISGFTQLLERQYRGKLDANADEYIRYVVDGASRMQRLIDDLLLYSRVGRDLQLGPADAERVLGDVLQDLAPAINEAGATVTHDPLPRVRGEAGRLGQVFSNLISNALKFHSAEPPRVHVTASPDAGGWRFSVRDNGIGIAPEHISRLFVLFHRLHGRSQYPGTGIGLALCKKIVERLGGRIWVESSPGQGSTFHFTLPAWEEGAP